MSNELFEYIKIKCYSISEFVLSADLDANSHDLINLILKCFVENEPRMLMIINNKNINNFFSPRELEDVK